MFEVDCNNVEFIDTTINKLMSKLKPKHVCKCCGKDIKLKWNSKYKIFDGDYTSEKAYYSALFGVHVPKIGYIVCNKCL